MRLRKLDRLKYKSQSEQPKKLEEVNDFGNDEEKDLKEDDDFDTTGYSFNKSPLRNLPKLILLFAVFTIVISVGMSILSEVNTDNTSITLETLNDLKEVSNWLEIIALVIAATIVIGILWAYIGGLI